MEKQKKSVFVWIKEHKVEIIVGAFSAIALGVGTVLVIKNKDEIIRALSSSKHIIPEELETQSPLFNIPDCLQDVPLLEGETFLPTELGNKVLSTAQKINIRLTEAGLQERISPYIQGYRLTEFGKLFGKVTSKGDYTNIEWDQNVLYLIFTLEELQAIAAKQELAKKPAIPTTPLRSSSNT